MRSSPVTNCVQCAAAAGLALLLTTPCFAGVRPVQIGVNSQWDPQLAKDAKLGWVRLNIWWKDVQPSQGTWNWSGVDSAVNGAYNKGLNVLAIVGCPPQWMGGGTNCTKPPLTLTEWKTFVDAVANRYKNGKVDAYEIWNEPDFKDHAVNIGWNRPHTEPPYYADFTHVAAQAIRQRAPGTPVVVPAFSSRADNDSKKDRRRQLLEKLETIQYSDGHASSFVDVISAHANGLNDRGPIHTAQDLRTHNLAYVSSRNPRNKNKPVWVTEYGWKSGQVGGYQKVYICQATKAFTGYYEADDTGLDQYDIRKAFIYTIKGDGTWGIYNDDNTPKPVVPGYLQKFSFPAIQQPATFFEFPACMTGSPPPECEEPLELISWADVGVFGLADPSVALPVGFVQLYAGNLSPCCPPDPCVVAPSLEPFVVEFANAAGDTITFSASPTEGPVESARGELGAHGARWSRGDLDLEIAVSLAEGTPSEEAQSLVAKLARSFDARFDEVCMTSWEKWGESGDANVPITEPVPPTEYRLTGVDGLVESARGACVGGRDHAPLFEVTWSFENSLGGRVDMGAYQYETNAEHSEWLFLGDRLHWAGPGGVRYWVADTSLEPGKVGGEDLYALARSLDPTFSP